MKSRLNHLFFLATAFVPFLFSLPVLCQAQTPAPLSVAKPDVEWYAGLNGKQEGPFTRSSILSKIAAGTIASDTLIWSQGMANWEAAGKVQAFSSLFATSPSMPKPVVPGVPGNPTPGLTPLPAPIPQMETLQLTPEVWPVGEWPEGMAFDGTNLWVAESGQRTLAQLNLQTGQVIKRVPSGRLPVGMVSNSQTGDVYSFVATDQKLIKFSKDAKGGTFANLPEYPNSMTGDDEAIWVYLWENDSNENSSVVRYDQKTKASNQSNLLGGNGNEISKSGNHLWINQPKQFSATLSSLQPETLEKLQSVELNGFLWTLTSTEGAVFLAGDVGSDGEEDVDGLIVRVDPFTLKETARKQVPNDFILKLAADDDYVVAANEEGTRLWVFSADDLTLLRTITLDWRSFRPASLLILEDTLYITSDQGNGDKGSILKLEGWAPMRGHP